jgi:hypothetical protein
MKEIVIRDRVRKMESTKVDAAIKAAKAGTSGLTEFGIRIKRFANTLILL